MLAQGKSMFNIFAPAVDLGRYDDGVPLRLKNCGGGVGRWGIRRPRHHVGKVGGETCVAIHIRGPETDQRELGVRRTLVMTGCALCPMAGIAEWLDMQAWHHHAPTKIFRTSIAINVNIFLKGLAVEFGMGPTRVSSHSMRAGCATTLYANGVGPIDIQRRVRCISPVYMGYFRRGGVELHTFSFALTIRTYLSDHLLAPEKENRKGAFQCPYRCGGKNRGDDIDSATEGAIYTPFDAVESSFDRTDNRRGRS